MAVTVVPEVPLGTVFVPGGNPTITYNPRERLHLEQQVRDYLDERHRILSVSGPTKIGKSVLLRNIVKDAIWLHGGNIDSLDAFWDQIIDDLDLYTDLTVNSLSQASASRGGKVNINAGLIQAEVNGTRGQSATDGTSLHRNRPKASVVLKALDTLKPTLVIDDFHYIDTGIQLQIVRALKNLVFEGMAVIVAAVPHRAYDAIRVESEMTGRVQPVKVAGWSSDELFEIAANGFKALGLKDTDGISHKLAEESFSSPHLMQEFCLALCKQNDVRKTVAIPRRLDEPDWDVFFSSRASASSRTAFDQLVRGPRQRSDRKPRSLKDGQQVDIYGAVLAAVAASGPRTELTYEELRSALKDVMLSEAPQRHETVRVLDEMAKIAREKIQGEPVVDYDAELSTLFISDPFFAYFLRWGQPTANLPSPLG